ncbi:hypothetical protein [Synechococcus sp. MIT S1220]
MFWLRLSPRNCCGPRLAASDGFVTFRPSPLRLGHGLLGISTLERM